MVAASEPVASIASRAMLVDLSISQWTGSKKDKSASIELADSKQADRSSVRVHKDLITREYLKPVQSAIMAARLDHYKRTLAWSDSGPRILSADGYFEYKAAMDDHSSKIAAAADVFCSEYPRLRADVAGMLGDLYDPRDYPPDWRIREKFAFTYSVLPFPEVSDFRVDLGSDEIRAVHARIEHEINTALASATQDVIERIRAQVQHMIEKLSSYAVVTHDDGKQKTSGIFRDSMIANMRDLVALVPSLNITHNPEITRVCDDMQRDLLRFEPAELRNDSEARRATVESAQSILDRVSAII